MKRPSAMYITLPSFQNDINFNWNRSSLFCCGIGLLHKANIDNSSVMIFCVSHALCTLQMPRVSVTELDGDKYFRTRENFTGEGN